MKELQFQYHMEIQFDAPVTNHRFTIKSVPLTSQRQCILQLQKEIYPNRFISEGTDAFGNHCIYGYCQSAHQTFCISVKGIARTGLKEIETVTDIQREAVYKYQTPMTKPGVNLTQFWQQFAFSKETSNRQKALDFMTRLYQQFQYTKGVTKITTTAEEAFAKKQGVCQDYSHILLSLCRMEHIPARYVVGMLLGEGLSHAWVEIYDNSGWIALDPTNNVIVNDQHIKISHGRDYQDCLINQGIFTGNAKQVQNVSVVVREI